MKPFVQTSLALAVLALSACNGNGDNLGNDQFASSGPAFNYELTGLNTAGKTCTTGTKKFESLRQMCINIQDDTQNEGCASAERAKKFDSECASHGFTMNESLECKFALLDPSATVDASGAYDKQFEKAVQTRCVGRNPVGAADYTGTGVYDSTFSGADFTMRFSELFVPRSEDSPSRYSRIGVRIVGTNEDGRTVRLIPEFVYNGNGDEVVSGLTKGGGYRFVASCGNVWACAAR